MYQQIQKLNTEEKALEISKMWRRLVQNATFMNFKQLTSQIYEHAKSIQQNVRFWMSNNFRNIHMYIYTFKARRI
jgi:transcriptional regulatory protein LevR